MRFSGHHSNLKQVLSRYNIENFTSSLLEDGIINTSYAIKTKNGNQYVLRIYRNNNRLNSEIEGEIAFMEHLKQFGVPTPSIERNSDDKFVTEFTDDNNSVWQAILMEYIQGRHLAESDINLLPEFARYQATMHNAACEYQNGRESDNNLPEMLDWLTEEKDKALKKLNIQIQRSFDELVTEILQQIEEQRKQIDDLPAGYTHLDYDSDNVIINDQDQIIGILDFDDISRQPFMLDSAFSLWWWLFFNETHDYKQMLSTYFENYKNVRSPGKEEERFIFTFIRLRNATMAALLYINLPSEPDIESFKKAIDFDATIRELKV